MRRGLARLLGLNALVLAAYAGAGAFGLSLAQIHPSASAVWPPTGIAIAALVLGGLWLAPGVFLGALAVNVPGTGAWAALIALGNTAEALLAAFLILRFVGRDGLLTTRGAVQFTGIVLLSTTVAANFGVSALLGQGSLSPAGAGAVWLTWWLGDTMGGLLVGSVILLIAPPVPALTRPYEAAVIAGAALATSAVVFLLSGSGMPLAFVPLPLLILLAARAGPRPAVFTTLAIGAIALVGTLRGLGPFGELPPNQGLLVLQTFLGLSGVTTLVVAAAAHSHDETTGRLHRAKEGLETAVADRTASLEEAMEELRHESERRQKVHEQMMHSRRLLAVAQRIAQVGSWEWDVKGDRITWSDELYRIYGIQGRPEIDFEAFLGRIHPDDRERVQGIVGQAMETRAPFRFEHRIVRDDGEERTLHGEGLVEVEDGKVIRMMGTGQDITERLVEEEARKEADRTRMELERLRQLDEFKSGFLSMAAHELSTPMTPLRLQLHILQSRTKDASVQRGLGIMERNLERLSRLVGDLLQSARIQSGRIPLQPEPVDIRRLVDNTLETFRDAAKHNGVVVQNEFPAGQAEVDPEQFGHVLYNLISNAIKFSPGGHVRLAGDLSKGLRLEVHDDGIGLDEEQMAHLFEPFQRVHDPAMDIPGTGLGLAICKGLVEAHGGHIEVSSKGPGKGTTFVVEIREKRLRSRRPSRPPAEKTVTAR